MPNPRPLDGSNPEPGTAAQLVLLKQQLAEQDAALAETMSFLEELGSTPLPLDSEFIAAFGELTERTSGAPIAPVAGSRC
jgi:hypothetical protein